MISYLHNNISLKKFYSDETEKACDINLCTIQTEVLWGFGCPEGYEGINHLLKDKCKVHIIVELEFSEK